MVNKCEKVPDDWKYHSLPMYLKKRKHELETFSVEENDQIFWTPKGFMKVSEGNNEAMFLYVRFAFRKKHSSLSWKTEATTSNRLAAWTREEFKMAIIRILGYVQEKPAEYDNLLWQYWCYFDVLRFEYRKIFYCEIQKYLQSLISNPPSAYEQSKKARTFLRVLTNRYCSSFIEVKKPARPLLERLPSGYLNDSNEMKHFFRAFNETFFTRLSIILRKNKHYYFNLIEPRVILDKNPAYSSIVKELDKRNLIFKEVTRYLQEYLKILNKDELPKPLSHLVYSSSQFSNNYMVIFEAIELFIPEKINLTVDKHLDAVENVIYLFPELLLYVSGNTEIISNDVIRPAIVVVEEENRTLQTLRRRLPLGYWFPHACNVLPTGLCSAAVRSYLLSQQNAVSDGEPSTRRYFRYTEVDHPEITRFPIKFKPMQGSYDKHRSYRIFIEECRQNGHFFYQCIFGCGKGVRENVKNKECPLLLYLFYTWEADNPEADEKKIYYLVRFLRDCEPVRELFNQPGDNYQEIAVAVFCNLIDSMIRLPSLLVYYHLLKDFLRNKFRQELSKRIKSRQAAEFCFMDFFERSDADFDSEFKDHARKRPIIFYLCFVQSFNIATTQGQSQRQTEILQLFCKVLYETPKLRKYVEDESNWDVNKFRERLHNLLNSGPDYVPDLANSMFKKPLNDVFTISFHRRKTDIDQFPKSYLTEIERLGQGRQSQTFLVKTGQFPLPLVAKYFNSAQEDDFLSEIECLVKMQLNPHVVQIFGFITENDNRIGILMEYCKGDSLDTVIRVGVVKGGRAYREKDIVSWTVQAASGLNYLHDKGILYRNVKPENMLLDEFHSVLKIGGISRTNSQRLSVTRRATTPDGENLNSTSFDVFGLGRSVWEMIVRVSPDDGLVLEFKMKPRPGIISEPVWDFVFRMMPQDKMKLPSMEECYQFFNKRLQELTKRRN